jgi:archaemetzincin
LLRLCKKEAVMNGFDKILGVTDVDIYADKASFIFGQAELHGKAAIVSIYRLKNNGNDRKDTGLVLSRVLKEAVHEMGHTLGLKHCNLRRCVMYFSKNIEDTDTKSYLFCEDCKYMLDGYVKDIPAIR